MRLEQTIRWQDELRFTFLVTFASFVAMAFLLPGCSQGSEGATTGTTQPAAITAAAPTASERTQAKPGYAIGRVALEDGTAISTPGADIRVFIDGVGDDAGRVGYQPVVKTDGRYEQKLVLGSFRYQPAQIHVPLDGKMFRFELADVQNTRGNNQRSEEGIVQDFVWKLKGQKPGAEGDLNNHTHWYGQHVNLLWSRYRDDLNRASLLPPDGTKFVFTLTPKGKRIDGAPAETLSFERTFDHDNLMVDSLADVPAAGYLLSGEATLPDGTKRSIVFVVKYAKYETSRQIDFRPDDVGGVKVNWALQE